MLKFKVLLLAFLSISTISYTQTEMDNTKMEQILKNISDTLVGSPGNWQVIYGEQFLFVITDEMNNRMRIFTPITSIEELKEGELEIMLKANFHAALDAKYAIFEDLVVSLFTHPLKELTTEQFKDAVKQVAVASQNFGTTYSSTDLIFPGGLEEEKEEEDKDKKINQKPKKT